jgi:hypothetical protein
MVLGPVAGVRLAVRLDLDALFLMREDAEQIRTVAVGRLFAREPAAMVPAEGN